MSEPLADRIRMRLKFVQHHVDRRLLMEAMQALEGPLEAAPTPSRRGFFVPQEPGESRAGAIKRICGQGLLPWAKKRLEEADL